MIFHIDLSDFDCLPNNYFYGEAIYDRDFRAFYVVRAKTSEHDSGWCRARIAPWVVEDVSAAQLDEAMAGAEAESTGEIIHEVFKDGERYLQARAKAFAGEGVKKHRFLVDTDGWVRVFDPVARYYTWVHSLSKKAQGRIRKLADAKR